MKLARIVILVLCTTQGIAGAAEKTVKPPAIGDHTAEMSRHDGFFPYYWDARTGQIWLEIDKFESEFLYVSYLSRGLGSNDLGLDRGQISSSAVVSFRRIGPKVLMVEKNYAYRATSGDPDQLLSVDESFAHSTLWGFKVAAESGGRVLVDATDFLLRDARDVTGTLARQGQGRFTLAESRSALEPERTKNFPLNTEFEAVLTFTADTAGFYVRQVAPTPNAFTVGQHHSFVQLPESGYKPRRDDPRCGYFSGSYVDHSAPLTEPNTVHYIIRHRLQKTNPGAAPSEVVEPIVYYVDRGVPEPMRSALIEGASWWNAAFEAAGFRNAFRVELMPADADPLDLRYNTIQWVHRATRGWSYGNSVVDPRTGEVLKGHVTLGSLRARQDYLIAEGILSPYHDAGEIDPRMEQLALARLRQLACHEVGHTLGLAHNFAASAHDRASVMDYPYPQVAVEHGGAIDLSDAYGVGTAAWDRAAITYGYQEFAAGTDEDEALGRFLDSVYASGQEYISDADARASGGAHPRAHLWDNGADAVAELTRLLGVRKTMLAQFSANAVRTGTPLVKLEETLVPIYMFHRYQLEAVPKIVGGVEYHYAVRDGYGDPQTQPVSADRQLRALRVLLDAIAPDMLALDGNLVDLLQPQSIGYVRDREIFDRRTGYMFDLTAAAESVADIPIHLLFHPQRAARLVAQHAADPSQPGLQDVIDALIDETWKGKRLPGLDGQLRRTVDNLVLHHLIRLANTADAQATVRAIADDRLRDLRNWLDASVERGLDLTEKAHFRWAANRISAFLSDPSKFDAYRPVSAPSGSPIGTRDWTAGCQWGQ